jgi:hypothetical protein
MSDGRDSLQKRIMKSGNTRKSISMWSSRPWDICLQQMLRVLEVA